MFFPSRGVGGEREGEKELLLRGYGMHGWNEKGKMFSFYARGQKLFSPSDAGTVVSKIAECAPQ